MALTHSEHGARISLLQRRASAGAGVVAAAVGTSVLAGWALGRPALKGVLPGLATMKPNTAALFLLCGVALALFTIPFTSRWRRSTFFLSSSVCVAVSLLTICEYLFGWNLALDKLLFQGSLPTGGGRMAFATAVAFLLSGVSLTLLGLGGQLAVSAAQGMALITGGLSALEFSGYLYNVKQLYSFGPFNTVAIHTAITFGILSIGILLARPGEAAAAVLSSPGPGGLIARRVIPCTILVPYLGGLGALAGQRAGLYGPEIRLALFATFSAASCLALTWLSARAVEKSDRGRRQADEILRQQASLLDLAPVLVRDMENRIIFWSRGAESIYGYTADEAEGQISHELLQSRFPVPLEEIAHVLETEGVWAGKLTHRRKSGEWATAASQWLLYRDAERRPLRILETNADITEIEQAQEARSRLAAIVESTDDAIIATTLNGIITDWNKAAERLYGYRREEALGRPNLVIIPPERGAEVARILETINRGEGIEHLETVRVRKDGTALDVSVTISPLKDGDGKLIGASSITRDITERNRSDEALRSSEARFRALVTASSDVVYRMSPDWTEMRQLHGLDFLADTRESNRNWLQQYIHPDDQPRVLAAIQEAIRTKTIFQLEHPVLRADGSLGWTFSRAIPLQDERGEIVEWFGAASDISERKHAEEALRRTTAELQEAQRIADMGSWTWDPKRDTVTWSEEIYAVFGLDPSLPPPRLSESSHLISHESWAQLSAALQEAAQTGAACQLDLEVVRGDGATKWITVRGEAQRGERGEITLVRGTIQDITDRKRLDERLRASLQEKETLLKELEAFSYTVAHDLRAPLRHMDGFLALLVGRSSGQLDETARRYVDRVTAASRTMGLLIDDLLQFSRLGRREMAKAAVNLEKLVHDVRLEFESETGRRSIDWRVSRLPEVTADASMLHQVMVSLISNALKFTRPRAQARIEIGAVRRDADEDVIFVKDNGVGFDEKYSNKLFGVFHRLHAQEEFEGTGVGLANVRRIVERHGGKVWAKGAEGEGATFSFSLPRVPKAELVRDTQIPQMSVAGTNAVDWTGDKTANANGKAFSAAG